MSVRINFEIGHEAAIRTKRTQEGFTHDWEVFVRGCDGANIHYYVEKVVFYLHETFPKPKRVIKEPPYSVKESGYAGFTLPVEIHLRNKDEPKKISLNYDLHLQPSGAPISEVQNKKYVFNMPGEDFKLKLLKGGGIIVNSSNSQETTQENRSVLDDKLQLVSKPRLGGSDVIRKHKTKIEEPRNSFHALFGAPITKTSKTSIETKPIVKDKNSNVNKSSSAEKEKSKSKHSPHKEKEKFREKDIEKIRNRDEKKRDEKKERSKDRDDRIKEKKERREKSPKPRSPTPTKRSTSPKRPLSPVPTQKHKDEKKIELAKERKNLDDRDKQEKKLKKEKRDKEKERKDSKYKDRGDHKSAEQKENKNVIRDKEKLKEPSPLPPPPPKNGTKEKLIKEKDILKDYKETKEESSIERNGKIKPDEKTKHKHKRKDRDKKDKEKVSEKSHKLEKKIEKSSGSKYSGEPPIKESPKENEKNLFNSPKQTSSAETKPKKPLNALIAEFVDSDSSNSSISSHEDLFNEPAPVVVAAKPEPKKEATFEPEPDKVKVKRDKTKRSKDKKSEKSSEKKRKRKTDANKIEEPLEKVPKEESSNSKESDIENCTNDKQENEENYEDYMNILRDLQHKILSLQDNSELQRVVQLIAETGRFEVSAQTFDFDLCLLERSTITQLQKFFQSSS